MYANDTCHEYTQKHSSLAHQNAKLSSKTSQCAALNVIMSLKEVTYIDEWNHIGNTFETSRLHPFANSVRDTNRCGALVKLLVEVERRG